MASPGNLFESDISKCLEFIGRSRDVLLVGRSREELANALDARGCSVDFASIGRNGLGDGALDGARSNDFDVVILHDVLAQHEHPEALLAESSKVLRKGGFLLAILHNAAHGRQRLAALQGNGTSSLSETRGLRLQDATALFAQAKYRVDGVGAVRRPIFGYANGLPRLERDDFPADIVAEVEADPDSDVYEFVVKAIPKQSGQISEPSSPPTLGEIEHSAAAIEARVVEMATRRRRQEEELGELREQVFELEEQVEAKGVALSGLESDLRMEHANVLRLQTALGLQRLALKKADDDWFSLYDELEAAREQTRVTAIDLRKMLDRLCQREQEIGTHQRLSHETIGQLRSEVASLAEQELASRKELLAVERRAAAEAQELRERDERLRARLMETERALAEKIEALSQCEEELLEKTEAEAMELATLIETVQSSRFWSLKRWFKRFRLGGFVL